MPNKQNHPNGDGERCSGSGRDQCQMAWLTACSLTKSFISAGALPACPCHCAAVTHACWMGRRRPTQEEAHGCRLTQHITVCLSHVSLPLDAFISSAGLSREIYAHLLRTLNCFLWSFDEYNNNMLKGHFYSNQRRWTVRASDILML